MGSRPQTPTERKPHRHLQSTPASATECRNCRELILNGWDEGLHVRVGALVIGEVNGPPGSDLFGGEARAILSGRLTYVRTSAGDLVLRTAQRIRDGHPTGQIHAEHKCAPTSLLELLT